jgi:tRNA nucleotidyltransferase/poly(A) polymerase
MRPFEAHAEAMDKTEQPVTTRTTRITVETETLLVIRRAKAALAWCVDCGAEVNVITIENHNLAESITVAQIREWRNTGKLHLWQAPHGSAQICVTSLLQCFESEEVRRFCRTHQDPSNPLRRKQV